MPRKILVTRPRHDMQTAYLYDFSEGLIKSMRGSKAVHITELRDSQAVRANLEKVIPHENPGLVFLNGHGDGKSVGGYKDETILDCKNIALTKGRIVYALACESLSYLGEIAAKQGTKAYIGYRDKFMVIRDLTRTSSPSKDINALPFKKVCSVLINALAEGKEVKESIGRTRDKYRELIKSYGTSKDDYGDVGLIRFALAWDLEFLDMAGDPSARFT
ncbi:MAG: hypothetical protein KJ955_05095 [Nanoarchaeota archaeon]|nr:hypothetical protein [Nanoarchaeota archaeon]